MSENQPAMQPPCIAEVRLFGFDHLPAGWRECNGAELRIDEHQPLFFLLGWRFGGDGRTTFALPSLRIEGPEVFVAIAVAGVLAEHGDDE